MTRLHFVGDGPRDAATVPHLVSNILGTKIEPTSDHWARLNDAKTGYRRRLLFAVAQAKDVGASGLVAVVDRDKSKARSRLTELQEARKNHRVDREPFPTALGEAVPHGEAWLLDDQVAVKQALALGNEVDIPNVRKTKDPKTELDRLISESRYRDEKYTEVLTEIARRVDHVRCMHGDETGFTYLAADVRREFECLVPKP